MAVRAGAVSDAQGVPRRPGKDDRHPQAAGIGCGGQMHGPVALDAEDNVLRPAILWNDGHTAGETEYLNPVVAPETLFRRTANIAFAGFTAPSCFGCAITSRSCSPGSAGSCCLRTASTICSPGYTAPTPPACCCSM